MNKALLHAQAGPPAKNVRTTPKPALARQMIMPRRKKDSK